MSPPLPCLPYLPSPSQGPGGPRCCCWQLLPLERLLERRTNSPFAQCHPGLDQGGPPHFDRPRPCCEAGSGRVVALKYRWENSQSGGGGCCLRGLTCTWPTSQPLSRPPTHSPASSHLHTHRVCPSAHSTQKPYAPCILVHSHALIRAPTFTHSPGPTHVQVHTPAHSHIHTHSCTRVLEAQREACAPFSAAPTLCGVTVALEHWQLRSGEASHDSELVWPCPCAKPSMAPWGPRHWCRVPPQPLQGAPCPPVQPPLPLPPPSTDPSLEPLQGPSAPLRGARLRPLPGAPSLPSRLLSYLHTTSSWSSLVTPDCRPLF